MVMYPNNCPEKFGISCYAEDEQLVKSLEEEIKGMDWKYRVYNTVIYFFVSSVYCIIILILTTTR